MGCTFNIENQSLQYSSKILRTIESKLYNTLKVKRLGENGTLTSTAWKNCRS